MATTSLHVDTLIIGAGYCGLTALFYAKQQNMDALVIESSHILGGRARQASFNDEIVDNGQHIAIGGYENLLKLVKDLKLDIEDLFKVIDLEYKVLSRSRYFNIKFSNLSSVFTTFYDLLKINLPLKKKFTLIKQIYKISDLKKNHTVDEFFQTYKDNDVVRHFYIIF